MAKPKQKPSPKARARPAAARPVPPAPPVEVPVTAPVERTSRRALVTAALVVSGCGAATVLLLSGWTPGPGLPKPPRSAAPATTAPRKVRTPAKPRSVPKRSVPKRAAAPAPAPQSAAAQLFAGECGFCHTLADAGTTGRAGPNLDRLRPSRQRVLDAIAAGGRRTGLMPPGILSGAEAQQVARYVARVTHR